jgi:hypothetical protein
MEPPNELAETAIEKIEAIKNVRSLRICRTFWIRGTDANALARRLQLIGLIQ